MYIGYGIAFDGAGLWSFGNDFDRNVVISGVDNSSSSHTDNCHNDFLLLGEGPTDDINGSVDAAEQTFSINFSKAKIKLYLSLHYNGDNNYLLVNTKKTCRYKADNKNVRFPTQFSPYPINLSKKKYH